MVLYDLAITLLDEKEQPQWMDPLCQYTHELDLVDTKVKQRKNRY